MEIEETNPKHPILIWVTNFVKSYGYLILMRNEGHINVKIVSWI